MKLHGKSLNRLLAVLLAVVLLAAAVPYAQAADDSLDFGVVSDIHYYPESYTNVTPAFEQWVGNKQYINQPGLMASMFAFYKQQAAEGKLDCLIVPGDLTHNGELQAHRDLAALLEQFEADTGVPVFVINGNHDINNSDAASFANGESAVKVERTGPEQWLDIYRNLGYDMACATYTPPAGTKAGMLSYAVELGNYRLIFMDGGQYSVDGTEKGRDEHETAGHFTEGLQQWVDAQLAEAKRKGQTPLGIDHWSLVPHYDSQDRILQGFTLTDWQKVSERFADEGLHYYLTGHSHSNDVATNVNDNGELIVDMQTAAMSEFPHLLHTASLTRDGGSNTTLHYQTHDIDEVLPVVNRSGDPYPQPYRTSFSFNYIYKGDIGAYAKDLVKPMLSGLFADIMAEGGLAKYLDNRLGLEDLIFKYIGGFSQNAMWFIEDLGAQIDARYIADPTHTFELIDSVIDQLCDLKVSDYPCTSLYDEYGYTNPRHDYGTFGDLALVLLTGMAAGNELNNDPFMLDVLDQFENGDLAKRVFDFLYDAVVNQLVKGDILPNLYVHLDKLFPEGYEEGPAIQAFLGLIVGLLNGTDAQASSVAAAAPRVYEGMSYLELAEAVLKVLDRFGVLEGGSIDGALAALMTEYITESQYQAWGHTFNYLIDDLGNDHNPGDLLDWGGTISYTGPRAVPATQKNYRLPSLISQSLTDKAGTEFSISWYSKYTLEATDIEVIADGGRFTGKNALPQGVTATKSQEHKTRTFPGVDLGVIGFFPYELDLVRHVVKLSGLKPGATYRYRVGNAARGWWSDEGIIRTADGSDEVTFLHVTDSQAQNERQYAVFGQTLDAAFDLYPDTDLILEGGDMSDYGSNVLYWGYFFASSDKLRAVPVMPVAGNHETMGKTLALTDNFVLPIKAEQDLSTGAYYSFDYNNVHFIMLNTNDSDKNGLSEAQTKWLRRDAMLSNARWKIVVVHKATYSNGSHFDDKEVKGMREQFASLMPQLGIDMVFEGHDHVYLRTDAMLDNKVVKPATKTVTYNGATYEAKVDPTGTIYAITGASGCKNYIAKPNSETDKLFPRAESIVVCDVPAFAGVRVTSDTLYYDAYTVTGGVPEKIDSFAIYKDGVYGDANGDGALNLADVYTALRLAADIETPTAAQMRLCDLDKNGAITTDDARGILKKVSRVSA